jgi:hypothetical protein
MALLLGLFNFLNEDSRHHDDCVSFGISLFV